MVYTFALDPKKSSAKWSFKFHKLDDIVIKTIHPSLITTDPSIMKQ